MTGNSNKKYAFFLDIDGTLMSGGKLPEQNISAIARAQALGHLVFINTGRSFSFIPHKKLEGIKFDGICAGCGSQIVIGGEQLYSVALEQEFVAEVADYYLKIGKTLFFEGEGACFWVHPELDPKAHKMIESDALTCYEVTDAGQFLGKWREQRISKLSYWGTGISDKEKALWQKHLRVIEHATYVESVIYGCNKATAIERTLRHIGLARECSVAMGDSENDREMLKYAAISVAMGNATDKVKELCTYVSTEAADGGVAHAFEHIIKGQI